MGNAALDEARFWARLASLESLEELPKTERQGMAEHSRAMLGEQNFGNGAIRAALRAGSGGLVEAYKIARECLPPLVDRQPHYVELGGHYRWELTPDGFDEQLVGKDIQRALYDSLARTLRSSGRLLMRCPECRTIFVRVRRQRYCSPICTSKVIERARAPRKTAYMRDYMRKKRRKDAQRRARERSK